MAVDRQMLAKHVNATGRHVMNATFQRDADGPPKRTTLCAEASMMYSRPRFFWPALDHPSTEWTEVEPFVYA